MAEPFTYGGQTIFSNPIFFETILPFVLIFTIVFAILQKSNALGKDKKQLDAIIALVVGLITISFANAIAIIDLLVPFLAVSLVVILIFMILVGSFWEGEYPKGVQWTLLAIVAVAIVIAVMQVTGAWQYMLDLLYGGVAESELFSNIIFVVVIIAAIGAVIWTSGKKD